MSKPLPNGAWIPDPKPEDTAEAQRLIDEGYHQTSSRYRAVARVPPHYPSALEALSHSDPGAYRRTMRQAELSARGYLLRCSNHDIERRELTIDVFAEFKRLNGPVA